MLGYFDRFNPATGYEAVMFRESKILQSSEMNELQSMLANRIKGLGDALYKDGDVIRDCRVSINSVTGLTQCEAGSMYIDGAARGLSPATLTIPVSGNVSIGVYLRRSEVTDLEDPMLLDPAVMSRNFMQPGAGRRKVEIVWGYSTASYSGQGEFYPVYSVENGVMLAKEAPPNMDLMTQALARYDRDSAGGTYVVAGLTVQRLADQPDGRQVYTVLEGRCRVNGYGIEQATSRRLVYDAAPDLRLITSEPHQATTSQAQTHKVNRAPLNNVQQVTITTQKTATLTHGGYVGVSDPLPNSSVLEIVSVKQGEKTYIQGTDYRLGGDTVDWSLNGEEVATGSSYTVVYRHITTVNPSVVTADSFTITGAVPGSLVMVTYNQKLPRMDTLAIKSSGEFIWLKGVSSDWNPKPPTVPKDMLALATIQQTWRADYVLTNNAVRVVDMSELAKLSARMDSFAGLLAQQRLEASVTLNEAGLKKGLFVDPFLDDSLRDAGAAQTAAVFDGEMGLAVNVTKVGNPTSDIRVPTFLNIASQPYAIQQWARTGSMKVNPYMAFDPIPAVVTLYPAVDRWTEFASEFVSPTTRNLTTGSGLATSTTASTSTETLSKSSTALPMLRSISVEFRLEGFGPNETLSALTFDGVSVTPTAL